MPKNKTQGIIFGIIMSYSMAVGMEIYNNAIQQGVHLQPGGFTNLTYGIVGKALVEALFMNSVFLKINDVSFIFWLALGALMLETEDKVPAAERTL